MDTSPTTSSLIFWPVFWLLLFPITLLAQSVPVNNLEQRYLYQERIGRGLIFGITQDRQGVMWFATMYGLIKYDGTQPRYYRNIPGDSTSLSGDVTSCLTEDPQGRLWVGTQNSGLNIHHPITGLFSRYRSDSSDSTSLQGNKVNSILADNSGRVWIATQQGGLQLFDNANQQFIQDQLASGSFAGHQINHLYKDRQEQLWVLTDKAIFLGELKSAPVQFRELINLNDQKINFSCIVEDSAGNFWIGTRKHGLFLLDPKTQKLIPVALPAEDQKRDNQHIWQIYQDRQGTIWVATFGGLYYLHGINGQNRSNLVIRKFNLGGIKRALSVYESNDGVLWVGTNSGIRLFAPRQKIFRFFPGKLPGESIAKGRGVTNIARSGSNQIWTATIRGLFQFDPNRRIFHQDFLVSHSQLGYFDQKRIKAFYQDSRDKLWISTVGGYDVDFELHSYDLNSQEFVDHSQSLSLFKSHLTWNITEDRTGNVWFANDNGLLVYQPAQNSFTIYQTNSHDSTSIPGNSVNKIFLSKSGKPWVGTRDIGLFELEMDAKLSRHFYPLSGDTLSLSSLRIRDIYEDTKGQIWLGTTAGLNLFLPNQAKFRQFHRPHGLAENTVMNVLEDRKGNIWVTTPHWVSLFDQQKETFINYGEKDGIDLNDIWDNASFLDPVGNIYFGGDEGLLVFHPNDIGKNTYQPSVILTDFLLFNKPIEVDTVNGPLTESVEYAKEIILSHDQNVFTLHFSALSYINSEKNQYAYQLEGFDKDWQFIDHRLETTYTNLRPGTYLFKVKAANNDGIWGPVNKQLSIIIRPPWYQTYWAYGLWVLFFGTATYLIYRRQLNRQLEIAEKRRLLELNDLKSQFYTNITHEFRTPLTVILGMAEKVKEQPKQWLQEGVQMIKNNGHQLLALINQILDLSKLESRSLPVNWVNGDIIPFLTYISASFQSYAEVRSIKIHFQAKMEELTMDYDPEKIQSMLSNVISNAIKNTPTDGDIFIEVNKKKVVGGSMISIKIRDTGQGIPSTSLPYLFDRFYQVNQPGNSNRGTGIGLALTKQLVELLGGTISVKSQLNEGSIFTILLPVFNKVADKAPDLTVKESIPEESFVFPAPAQANEPSSSGGFSTGEAPLILIVEDNPDVATYLRSCLADSFETVIARDGKEGCEAAIKLIPDLIISDVMMPKRDGFQLCQLLKKDLRTSHIPIILLTAKADFESRLSGLDRGADAYMPKPFHRQELLIRIENLLESRQRLQAYFLAQHHWQSISPEEQPVYEQENAFLTQTKKLIDKGLDQGEYSVDQLARELNMSSSQLYRKITALTGRSAIKLLRKIQIDRTKELLANTDLPISDIAYQNGFKDPAYFTRVFTAETGMTPSSFRENSV